MPDRRKNSEYFKEQQKLIEERLKQVTLQGFNLIRKSQRLSLTQEKK